MKTLAEVKAMLAKFEENDEYLAYESEGVREALLWVLGHRSDEDLEGYLPEEE